MQERDSSGERRDLFSFLLQVFRFYSNSGLDVLINDREFLIFLLNVFLNVAVTIKLKKRL